MSERRYDSGTRDYLYKLLILGITLTGFGIYQLSTTFTFKSDLIQINGTVHSANTFVTDITDSKGHDNRKSELVFFLSNQKQKFCLAENIGNEYIDEKYEKLLEGLKQTGSVSVWIKKSEIDEYEPKVFQITNGNKTLLDFESVRTGNTTLALFLLLLGISSIIVFLCIKFPEKFRNIIGVDKQTNFDSKES